MGTLDEEVKNRTRIKEPLLPKLFQKTSGKYTSGVSKNLPGKKVMTDFGRRMQVILRYFIYSFANIQV